MIASWGGQLVLRVILPCGRRVEGTPDNIPSKYYCTILWVNNPTSSFERTKKKIPTG